MGVTACQGSRLGENRFMGKIIIGLVIPFVAVDLMLPWANAVEVTLFDVPFVYLWIFAWFILTSACLMTCWLLFDRDKPDDVGASHQGQ